MKRRGIVTVMAMAGLTAGAATVAAQENTGGGGGDGPHQKSTVESHQSLWSSGNSGDPGSPGSTGNVTTSLTGLSSLTHSHGHSSHHAEVHCSSEHGHSESHVVDKTWHEDGGVVTMQATCSSG
ncbi:hypothetical protein [Streptomyces sp. UNOC14_S4]|uniref:hypothetical protein n=1 Tax=Streptomyces sp. UNOC14_S4 TaxID=2872340 RepID=UPI001E4E845D|nr:hypothetical protein [Streptomyces sp. UNOC14_S4]MCC3770570.1 hypothetical protein [Streptomyces sp. UNOC14_S4]